MDALIFVDTNIFLDLYRIKKSEVSLAYLDRLLDCKSRLIINSQVEMEFKKNRQGVILESSKLYSAPDWNKLTPPALLSESQASKMIEQHKKAIQDQQKKIKEKLTKILENPSRNDPVFQKLQKIFKHRSVYNMDRESKIRFKIRNLARKRFMLGYPPRKSGDTSFGDAINWEWIIACANQTDKNIIIVTRDSDYGAFYDDKFYLNDWLKKEFQERVSRKRQLILTSKLSVALKLVNEVVTREMEEAEAQMKDFTEWLNTQLFSIDQT